MATATSAATGAKARLRTAAAAALVLASGVAATAQQATPVAADAAAIPTERLQQGEALFLKNCRLCHGSRGTSGKPLKNNENLADANYVASVILTGPGYMTAFADHLSDEEIALIATYVRNSWGNAYGPVDSADVAQMR